MPFPPTNKHTVVSHKRLHMCLFKNDLHVFMSKFQVLHHSKQPYFSVNKILKIVCEINTKHNLENHSVSIQIDTFVLIDNTNDLGLY